MRWRGEGEKKIKLAVWNEALLTFFFPQSASVFRLVTPSGLGKVIPAGKKGASRSIVLQSKQLKKQARQNL